MLNVDSLIDIAKQSSADQHKCAAAVYDKRGKLIATAWNQPGKSHPRQAHYAKMAGHEKRIYLHAEIGALVKCREEPYSIQIVRIGPKEYPKASYPCCICFRAIEEAGVQEIYYHDRNGQQQKEEI